MKCWKLVVFGLILILNSSLLHASDQAWKTIQSLGFSPIWKTASDINVVDDRGREFPFEKLDGKWSMIAFWASWCGPCQYELPQLEKLAGSVDFKVIAVSIDQNIKDAKRFFARHDLKLPFYHDGKLSAQNKLDVSAVPTIYLRAPSGQFVGRIGGAKEWVSSRDGALLSELSKHAQIEKIDEKLLNPSIEAPKVTAQLNKKVYNEGEPIQLFVDLKVKGNPWRYEIKLPKLKLPDGLISTGPSSESFSKGSDKVLRYIYLIAAQEPGEFETDAIELGYKLRNSKSFQYVRLDGLLISIKSSQKIWPYLFGTIAVFLIVIILIVRKRKRPAQTLDESCSHELDLYERLVTQRTRMSEKEFQIELLSLMNQVDSSEDVEKLTQQVKYAGLVLSKEKEDYYLKHIKRVVRKEDE